jgi:hypothetical protein
MIPENPPVFQLNFKFNNSVKLDTLKDLSLSNFNEYLTGTDTENKYIKLPHEIEFGPTISFIAKENFYKIICGVEAKGLGARIVVSVPEIGYYESYELNEINTEWQDIIFVEKLNFVKGKEIRIYLHNEKKGVVEFDNFNCVIFERYQLPKFTGIPKLKIKLLPHALNQLDAYKDNAIARSYISKKEKKYVQALVDEREMKLRIKGDVTDHLIGKKISFRIKDPKGNYSIQHPKARGYLNEWLWHKVLQEEGILTTDYSFVEVFINDSSRGLFAKELHFDTLFGLSQNKKGLVLKFNEDGLWDFQNFKDGNSLWQNYYVYDVAPITTFKFSKNTSGVRKEWFLAGAKIVSNLREGSIDSSKIDLDAFAKYAALNDLFGSYHGLSWNNVRFFYNSISKKIEPIGFDGFEHYKNDAKWKNTELMGLKDEKHDTIYHSSIYLWAQFFNYPGFTKKYLKNLSKFSSTAFLDHIKMKYNPEVRRLEKELHKEFSSYEFTYDRLENRQTLISTLLKNRDGFANEKNQFKFLSMFEWGNLHPDQVPNFKKNIWVESFGVESYVVGNKTKYRNLHPSSVKVVSAVLEDGTKLTLNETLEAYNPLVENKFIAFNHKVAFFVVMIEGKLVEIPVKTKYYNNYID